MTAVQDNPIDQLSLTEVNEAQGFIKFKKRWPARLKNLMYLGIALALVSGAGSAITNRDLHNYWETSKVTGEQYQKDYSEDKLLYGNSGLIFGTGFVFGLIMVGAGIYFSWKYNSCCIVESKLRKRENILRSQEYPMPKPKGNQIRAHNLPMTKDEMDKQYPRPVIRH
jgi:hypothetical protein